jgi:2-methylcitrate dehydratase
MDGTLKFLSDYCSSLDYRSVPAKVVHDVKRHVVDTLGCAMAGRDMGPPLIARAQALEAVSTPGSTIIGTRHKSSPELAAFANGVMARYLDFNDTARLGSAGHPSDNITAVLAAAEYAGADMHATIAGIVVAYEVQNRIGAVGRSARLNGWDHAIFVVLAAAAGAGRAIGLNQAQMANALALAAVANAAMGQTRVGQLSSWKGCTAPNAARNGVFAALLARRGMSGPDEAFDGPRGYKKQLGAPFELPPFGGTNVPYAIEADKFKCYPCDYEAQCSITPAIELHKAINGNVSDIVSVDVETYEHAIFVAADTRDKWNPTSRETADHSIPYVVAVALFRGTVWMDDFTDERIRDPEVLALMQKIEVRATEECTRAWPQAFPFRITLTTRSGRKIVKDVKYAKGHPDNPMSDAELEAKFRRLAEPSMGQARASNALTQLWKMEDLPGPRDVLELFVLD